MIDGGGGGGGGGGEEEEGLTSPLVDDDLLELLMFDSDGEEGKEERWVSGEGADWWVRGGYKREESDGSVVSGSSVTGGSTCMSEPSGC